MAGARTALRWTALVLVATLAPAGIAGCGSGDAGRDVEQIVLVAPGGDHESDWTLQAAEVVREFPRALGIEAGIADASQAEDVGAVFEQVGNEGNQLVIAHDSRYADAAAAVAADADVPTLVWGDRPAGEGPVAGVAVQDKEGGYLAGIIAAKAAITRRLGIVVADDGSAWDLATWNRTAGGFIAGARSVDPDVEIAYEQVGSDGDATAEDTFPVTRAMIADGTQMLLSLGRGGAQGGLRAIEEHRGRGETLYVGVIGDKGTSAKEPGGVTFVLCSVMWDTRGLFRQAVRDVRSGAFGERDYALTLANRGVWLYTTGRTPRDAYDEAMDAQRRIERGTLEVPATPTSERVEQLIAGGS